jgi:glycosyltransferase involved in cell wall biosynthesis
VKYWLLTTEYPPFFGGGISTYCHFTAKMFDQKGHQVSVFINDDSVTDVLVAQQEGVRIIRFNPSRTQSGLFLGHVTNISYEFAHIVRHFIESEGAPDLIEAQEYLGIAYYLLQYKHLLYNWCKNIPVVITMHSPSFLYMEYNHISEYKYPNFWICEMERFCLQAADLLISPSAFMLEELQKRMQLGNENVHIISNPFETAYQAEEKADTKADQIVFYGKLTVQKGAFKLLKYFEQLWDNGFSEPLYLIGGQDIVYHPEGKTMGDIIKQKYKKFIDAGLLKLEDRIKPAEIPNRLSKAKVVIIPSANDNLPYVVFEMMSLGKIVLVSKQGGHSEVIEDGVDGFVFDHIHPATFANQLKVILNLSEGRKQQLAKNAKQKVTTYAGLDAIYPKKMAVLKQLLGTSEIKATHFPFINLREPIGQASTEEAQEDLLSIIVPYYNMGAYITETIKSIQQSDYKKKEIIIVNDGSTDIKSLEILDRYREVENIIVYDNSNRGLGETRNFGARKANGKYIAFLDADDTVHPTYYSKAVNVLRHYDNVHFVGSWTQYFEGSSRIWPCFTPEPPVLLYHNTINTSALVFKRESFLTSGGNDSQMVFPGLEDYECIVSLAAKGRTGVALPEVLFNYRVRKDSMIRAISIEKKIFLLQQIAQKYKAFYGKFAAELANLLNANGPGYKHDNPSLDQHAYSGNAFYNRLIQKLVVKVKRQPALKRMALRIYRQLK